MINFKHPRFRTGSKFHLQTCEIKSDKAKCHILTTSEDQDKELTISLNNTRIFDSNGHEYRARTVELGSNSETATANYVKSVSNLLVAGIPMRTVIHFENLKQPVNLLTLLELSCTHDNKAFRVQIRNISIPEPHP